MSVSSLPEWKQLLLERKRREEEERERREKEEEKKLASMPAWKRGIIQRRRAKQEGLGDREKEKDRDRENVLLSSCDGDTDLSVTVHLVSEPSLSPDPGQSLDRDMKPQSQVSAETIVPVHKNPFIRTQSGWRKALEVAYLDRGSEQEAEVGKDKETERDRPCLRGHEGETGRGRETELKMERCWERRDGREHEKNTDKIKGRERRNSSMGKDNITREKERESLKDRKEEEREEEEERDSTPPGPLFPPGVPGLRTIRADNIIIIEQERKRSEERRCKRREAERERRQEDQERRGVTMDLRELLANGGSVTELRASEVLIIQPAVSSEERSTGAGDEDRGSGRDDEDRERERKCIRESGKNSIGREVRTDVGMMIKRDRGPFKEKERPWGQATVIKVEDRKGCVEERGGRVSQLLSKFGDNPKLPSRSKSSDHFNSPEDINDDQAEERKEDEKIALLRVVPRRSSSFSDRVVCAKENGMIKKGHHERRAVERAHSDRLVSLRGENSDVGGTVKQCWSRLSDSDEYVVKPGRQSEEYAERNETGAHNLNQQRLSVGERVRTVDKKSTEIKDDVGDESFTVASVQNTEGISFARRVPIRQDRGVRATERELKPRSKVEPQGFEKWGSGFRRVEGTEGTNPSETMQQNCDVTASVDSASPPHVEDRHYRHGSAFTECASLLTTVAHRPGAPHRGTEWSSTGPQEHHTNQSVLSQHTEDLISTIERVGETTVYHKGERASRGKYDINKESTLVRDAHVCGDVHSENLMQDAVLRSPKGLTPTGADTVPHEIQIPRTVFYVAEEKLESRRASCQSDEGQDRDGGREVERRNSWRIGKPLSRIESLREKIRQREKEGMTNMESGTEDSRACGGTVMTASQTRENRSEDSRTEMRAREWEATSQMRKSVHEVECGQDSPVAQTSTAVFDTTEEVNVLKDSPQLPVPLSLSQAARGEELTNAFSAATSQEIIDNVQPSEDEDDPLKYGEEVLRQYDSSERESEEEEEEELSDEVQCIPPLSLSESLSPSPPDPDSLAAMSRIYNLKTVGSRTGLCMRETVDIPQVQLVKVKPHITHHAQQEACHREDMSGVKTLEQHMKQLYLTEQEVMRPSRDAESTPQNSLPRNHNTKGTQLSPSGTMDDQHISDRRSDSPHLMSSPTLKHSKQPRTATITPRTHRSQSPDNSVKPVCSSPTPACSTNSSSPTLSPCASPSPSRCPLFSIRSATGGQVKRGATITITPKKSAAVEPTQAIPLETPMNKITAKQTHSPSVVEAEPGKKRYPTADEIEVIGGYQNLEKSCLMKNRGNPKRVKVCFDESQLEQVCEYPSEASMLACSTYPFDPAAEDEEEKVQEEEEEEKQRGVSVSRSSRIVTSVTGRVLTVGQYHPLLKKHKV